MPSPFDFTQPNPALDLTTIEVVHGYLHLKGTTDDSLIQLCITAASLEWIRVTGRGLEGQVPTNSPFVAPVAYDEFYDGNGSYRMFVRNGPIVSVQALLINGKPVTQSTGFGVPGWQIDQSKKSIVMVSAGPQRNIGRACGGDGFTVGLQNVEAQYTAGFSQVPPDVVEKCTKMVAINYKRSNWLDMASKSEGAGGVSGTTSYRAWDITPDVARVMRSYARDAIV
jgi:hypothetical protein